MILQNDIQLAAVRASGKILAEALKELCAMAQEGISTAELDLAAEKMIRAQGGAPTFLGYVPEGGPYPYPAALCTSINDEVVHGIPSEERVLAAGDVVSLDLGVTYEGMISDAARTIVVGGRMTDEQQRLIAGAREALKAAAAAARARHTVGDIGAAIATVAKKNRLGVVRELGGHGVGTALHEFPYIPNFGAVGKGAPLSEGMIVALEPILTIGDPSVVLDPDGYTYRTKSGSLAAHVEDTFLITKTGAEVLTR